MESNATQRSEKDLIAAILAGETYLYHELIRPHERTIYLMALAYMKNEADAEDVSQEAFVRAYRNLASFRADARFSTWVISIALNEARARLKKQAAVSFESLHEMDDADRPVSPALLRDPRETPSATLERKEIRALLNRAIETLPNIYRDVFLFRDVEELDVKETAKILQITATNVKVRLHRARIMLQRLLAPQLKTTLSAPGKADSDGHRVQTRLGSHFGDRAMLLN